jgi:redox-sensitive bicupin YhaK (pirin superfamily)
MSNLDRTPSLMSCGGRGGVPGEPVAELLPGRVVPLGGSTQVRRLLPTLGRRMVGPWCFIDHYGPDDIEREPGMMVPPHPHMGLQTVSWLRSGEVLHRDSLGSVATLRPGMLGLMTSGRAISHAEQSPRDHGRLLHGAQLWVALPGKDRDTAPGWEFHPDLPVVTGSGGLRGTVFMGEVDGAASPGTAYSPLVGMDLTLPAGTRAELPVEPDFEYAVVALSGTPEVAGVRVEPGGLLYLGTGRSGLPLRADDAAGLLLLGGEPFEEEIVMWWNFVARSSEEISQARAAWMEGDRFGTVHGYDGAPVPAPTLPDLPLKPRGRVR